LPERTTDLDRAKTDLAEHGYCLIADALRPDEVAALRKRTVEAALEDVDAGDAFIDSGGANQRVWALLNRGEVFCDLATHPLALELMDAAIGGHADPYKPGGGDDLPGFLLGSLTANIAGPGGEPMFLHADQGYVPQPWPPYPLVANVAWFLDDTTTENGATRIVPGSHKFGSAVPDADANSRAVSAEGPAGTALVFEGRVWHGTGRNTTVDEKRHVLLSYYCKPWIRTQENHTLSTDPAVIASASPTLRRLLGFDLYGSLGMVRGLRPIGMAPASHHQRDWAQQAAANATAAQTQAKRQPQGASS
jgi:ectoine hydroxylase-related dioxygenase (phytanoyl-CoA dioxygenase family)